jgi:type IV pilus assembly protein PilA
MNHAEFCQTAVLRNSCIHIFPLKIRGLTSNPEMAAQLQPSLPWGRCSPTREEKDLKKQKGFSLIELLIVVAIILIIAAIAIPNLLRARIAANESSAVSSLRTINTAEVTYATAYPTVGFSAALANLGPGGATCPAGGPTQAAACLIDNVLAGGAKSGYAITEAGGAANAQGIVVTYETEAKPQAFNQSGVRGFCSIEDAVIRWEANGTNAMGAAGCPGLTALQ